ncbi:hypothetical protein BUALT_Bualt01G0125200 [Buddleja alternifolia]|uniref:DUF659 domain-containing protein n=1 Tax=Buddleja alternifolia TaxID=168488 RepID=A0AAV6Y7K0_9LAMI|nr:hypothetical protein BUALT_Bualt01G0125200 [Buddleja alternifolia]
MNLGSSSQSGGDELAPPPDNCPLWNNIQGLVFKDEISLLENWQKWDQSVYKEVIVEVGVTNVVQIIIDNAPVCKATSLLIEQAHPYIFWTPCVVHTLNLEMKNICATKNTDANEIIYDECHWIIEIAASAVMIKNFILNHSMRLAMFNEFSKLKLLAVAKTNFASVIVMLKRFKIIKQQLQAMVISVRWSCYRDDEFNKARIMKERLLEDLWCSSKVWQTEHPNLSPSQSDLEISKMRKLCLKRLVPDEDAWRKVNRELAIFLGCFEHFGDGDSLQDRLIMSLMQWWTVHGPATLTFKINLRLLSRKTPQYMQGDTKMWDIGGDAFESSDDVEILEIANLSLGEPQLEHDLFVDEVDEGPHNDSDVFPNMED